MKPESGKRKAAGAARCLTACPGRRSAMTLFELLLVLVLLVVVGSLAAPLFEGSFASIRLRRGTDQVLATWSQARTHAIEAGKIYQFRFQSEGSSYRVDPWGSGQVSDSPEDTLEIDTRAATESTEQEIELENWTHAATLPEAIVFSAAESISQNELGQRTVAQLEKDSSSVWSEPILFYPDGTTSSASLLIKNSKNLYRRATLRALTGVARASETLTRDEVDRLQSQ